ncbi:MAG: DEAD/DEAH box helicase [Ilumatobacteraceae bacterium]|nr:DEAD/DEAH box helicase [Ilumatobacteraceae bacterium]
MKSFIELGVPAKFAEKLTARGITTPFEIQAAALPDGLAGHDVCGKAPTGSGKTIAFGLVLAVRLQKSKPGQPGGLVLVPTRELAIQVAKEIGLLCEGTDLRVASVYGGAGYGPQVKAVRGASIIVATPGRLEDLLERRDMSLSAVTIAVLDEADRMSDMGFLPAVRRLLRALPKQRQVMLFSATLDGDISQVVKEFQHEPKRHESHSDADEPDIEHKFWMVSRNDRVETIAQLVNHYERIILFCRTKHGCDRLAKQLDNAGVRSSIIHGNKSQAQRERSLEEFRRGRSNALVATDVAARGIHIDDVPCVVHFDPPADHKDYIHRSGRTGRAGSKGVVISLVESSQKRTVNKLARDAGVEADFVEPDFEPADPDQLEARPGALGGVLLAVK